jgi:hypothetical protein
VRSPGGGVQPGVGGSTQPKVISLGGGDWAN